MARKYKISVKHYLNKKTVKPCLVDGVEKYPIYYYITFMRRTIHKPSLIDQFFSEAEFEKYSNDWLGGLLKSERNEIEKIGNIFLEDYENDCINKKLKFLSNRGFTSKDEFINDFNSYVEFYSKCILDFLEDYIKTQTNLEFTRRLKSFLDFSMIDEDIIINTWNYINRNLESPKDHIFFIKNLNGDLLKLYYIYLKYYYDENQHFYFELCDWRNDKNEVINEFVNITMKKNPLDDLFDGFSVNINENDVRNILTPVLNEILTPEYQINKHLNN